MILSNTYPKVPESILKNGVLRNEPNGFISPETAVSVAFDNGTRTFSIQPVSASFYYYSSGLLYLKGGPESIQITDVEGLHYIYYDGNTLIHTTAFNSDIILKYAICAVIYWDATNNKQIYFGREYLHGSKMDGSTHAYLHMTKGFTLQSGGSLGDFTIGDGSLDAHCQFSNEATIAWDEDAQFSHSARSVIGTLPVYYQDGNAWRVNEAGNFPVITTGTGRAAYNNSGVLTECTNNYYVLCHIAVTNDTDRPYISFLGIAQYNTAANVRTAAENEINSLIVNGLPFAEFKFIATVILQTNNLFSNSVKSKIIEYESGINYLDLRGEIISRGGVTVDSVLAVSAAKIGSNTDYIQIDTLGVHTLVGDARVKNFFQAAAGAFKAPGSSPATYVTLGLDGAWEFSAGATEYIATNFAIQRGTDRTVAPDLRIGWSSPETSGNVKWQVEILWRSVNEDTSITTPDSTLTMVTAVSGTANGYVFSSFTLPLPSETDRIAQIRIARLGGDAEDTCSGVANLLGFLVEYTMNKIGEPV